MSNKVTKIQITLIASKKEFYFISMIYLLIECGPYTLKSAKKSLEELVGGSEVNIDIRKEKKEYFISEAARFGAIVGSAKE